MKITRHELTYVMERLLAAMKTEHQRGGHRPGAGRKPRPAGERRVTVTLRLPPELARHVDAAAERCGMTRTAVIVAWLEQGQRGASFP